MGATNVVSVEHSGVVMAFGVVATPCPVPFATRSGIVLAVGRRMLNIWKEPECLLVPDVDVCALRVCGETFFDYFRKTARHLVERRYGGGLPHWEDLQNSEPAQQESLTMRTKPLNANTTDPVVVHLHTTPAVRKALRLLAAHAGTTVADVVAKWAEVEVDALDLLKNGSGAGPTDISVPSADVSTKIQVSWHHAGMEEENEPVRLAEIPMETRRLVERGNDLGGCISVGMPNVRVSLRKAVIGWLSSHMPEGITVMDLTQAWSYSSPTMAEMMLCANDLVVGLEEMRIWPDEPGLAEIAEKCENAAVTARGRLHEETDCAGKGMYIRAVEGGYEMSSDNVNWAPLAEGALQFEGVELLGSAAPVGP